MTHQPPESALPLPSSGAIDETRALPTSALQEEVVQLFDEWRDRLLRYVISFDLPLQDGEDIVQEVFLSLFEHLQREKSRAHLRSWLFRVAHNLALKRCHLKRRQAQIFETADEATTVDPRLTVEEQLTNRQKERRALAVWQALSEQDRRCLSLRAEGLRYREIAVTLDISLGAVSLALARSLARLARASQW